MTTLPQPHRAPRIIAHVLSDVFSPMLAPSYALAAALLLTPMCYLPPQPKVWSAVAVAFLTCVVPMAFILMLIRMGRVSDTAITNRNERTAPFACTILCYVAAGLFMRYMRAPWWLQYFYLGAALVSAISLLVTHWWKISAHTGALGGVAGIMFWFTQKHLLLMPGAGWFCASVAVLGAVAWARLYLDKHTVLQTLAGAVLGFGTELAILNIIPR